MTKEVINIEKHILFTDLCEYYPKIHPALIFERLQYSNRELAIKWYMDVPSPTKKNLNKFYSTDLYIFDLTRYQLGRIHSGIIDEHIQLIKKYGSPRPSILEFGGGIGVWSSEVSKHWKVDYYDLPGPSQDYAAWRFIKHKSNIRILHSDVLDHKYQFVNCCDVLEHIPEKECNKIIDKLSKNAKYVFCVVDVPFNELYPMHIYDFKPYFLSKFEHVSGELYKAK